jgi:hypothetical protein
MRVMITGAYKTKFDKRKRQFLAHFQCQSPCYVGPWLEGQKCDLATVARSCGVRENNGQHSGIDRSMRGSSEGVRYQSQDRVK